jgi:hypothetical protein
MMQPARVVGEDISHFHVLDETVSLHFQFSILAGIFCVFLNAMCVAPSRRGAKTYQQLLVRLTFSLACLPGSLALLLVEHLHSAPRASKNLQFRILGFHYDNDDRHLTTIYTTSATAAGLVSMSVPSCGNWNF